MTVTSAWALPALIALLAFAAGWVARDLVDVLGKTGRRGGLLDLSSAAASGEIVRFDWDDPRTADRYRVTQPAAATLEAAGDRIGAAFDEGLRPVPTEPLL